MNSAFLGQVFGAAYSFILLISSLIPSVIIRQMLNRYKWSFINTNRNGTSLVEVWCVSLVPQMDHGGLSGSSESTVEPSMKAFELVHLLCVIGETEAQTLH